uniref:RING-type domain-containing protein n=1 Tax=Ditylenchus dipsaci TaxID=166011 RepID=A0A915CMD6_9BILA
MTEVAILCSDNTISTNNLDCLVCSNLLEDPQVLYCSHVFCGNCIRRLMKTTSYYAQEVAKFDCPRCSRSISIPEDEKFPSSLKIKDAVEKIKLQRAKFASLNNDVKSTGECSNCSSVIEANG